MYLLASIHSFLPPTFRALSPNIDGIPYGKTRIAFISFNKFLRKNSVSCGLAIHNIQQHERAAVSLPETVNLSPTCSVSSGLLPRYSIKQEIPMLLFPTSQKTSAAIEKDGRIYKNCGSEVTSYTVGVRVIIIRSVPPPLKAQNGIFESTRWA